MGSYGSVGFYVDVSRLELVSLLVHHNLRNNFLLVLRGRLSIRITGWYRDSPHELTRNSRENDEWYPSTIAEIYKRPKRQKMILRNKLGVKTHASHSN